MQPWLDVDEGGWAVVVTTDGDKALAERCAEEMAQMAWDMRDRFMVREAIAIGAHLERRPGLATGARECSSCTRDPRSPCTPRSATGRSGTLRSRRCTRWP